MTNRRRAAGAEVCEGGTGFRVWAPDRDEVSIVIDGRDHPLDRDEQGWFSGVVAGAVAGTRYRIRVDGGDETYPDPASRSQPNGPHGDSVVVDPAAYAWRDQAWRGVTDRRGVVISETHIGTFTREGTWRAAIPHLAALRDTGITMIELMPVNEFPGRFGWSYDGVDLWAPTRLYGTPDDFRAFVDAAHAHGLAVILDVVYNHLGPDGCYLTKFTPKYFTDKYENEWGDAVNFDGDGSEGVRAFFADNAAYWIDEFHLDGLRIDATQSMHDSSDEHILALIARRAREAAGERTIYLVGENEPQQVEMLERHGLDALWNDDWHHAALVALTGRREAYYTDYRGTAYEFVAMAQWGYIYQGQRYAWQKKRRGTPSFDIAPERLICFLANHDQLANSARGERVQELTSPGRYRALTALLLLGPNTPMLFQGQEFGATTPFLYFADHIPELAEKVAHGRREFLEQFPSIKSLGGELAAPGDPATFDRCKLRDDEREQHVAARALHRDLLRCRRALRGGVRAAALNDETFVLRWPDRLLLVNLGRELHLEVLSQPLLAPPAGADWMLLWSSEAPEYGGAGTPPLESDDGWRIPGEAALLLIGT